MGSLCSADGSKIMTEDDGYETIVPDLSASKQAVAQHEGGRGELVAWMYELEGEIWLQTEREPSFDIFDREPTETPLYAHPPTTRPAALAEEVARLREALADIDAEMQFLNPLEYEFVHGRMTFADMKRRIETTQSICRAALNEQPK